MAKLLNAIEMEKESKVWARIFTSLPAGQLSFLVRAGIDCLPSPSANLTRWRYQVSPSCPLYHARPCTTQHILNGCPTCLNQGRYTWRHDSILAEICRFLKTHLYLPPPLSMQIYPSYKSQVIHHPQYPVPYWLPLLDLTLWLSQTIQRVSKWLNWQFQGIIRELYRPQENIN